jgi:hypothetical protein
MAETIHAGRVLSLIYPEGEWSAHGDSFEDIVFISKPITKAQYEKGVADYSQLIADQEAKAESEKAAAEAKLAALGLTSDDLKALGL